jgi:hypothetical protein
MFKTTGQTLFVFHAVYDKKLNESFVFSAGRYIFHAIQAANNVAVTPIRAFTDNSIDSPDGLANASAMSRAGLAILNSVFYTEQKSVCL